MAIRYYVDPMVKNDKPTNEYDEIVFNSADTSSTQNSVYTLNHQKVGTTHYLRGFPILKMAQNVDLFVGQFRATATFNENDKIIMIDSTDGTTEVNMIAEPTGADSQMPDEAFVEGDLVSVTIDGVNKKLGFKLGGSGVNQTLPPQIRSFAVTSGNAQNKLSWLLPTDTTAYEGLTIVRKVGSAPTKVSDGTKIELSKTTTSYTDTGLTNDTKYYYRAFPYNAKKQYQTELTGAVVSGTPKAFSLPTYTGQHAIFGDINEGRIEMYGSGTLTLSEGIYDIFAVGGGGRGSNGLINDGGGGGGGGYTTTLKNKFINDKILNILISGSSPHYTDGGTTSVNGDMVIAYGGKSTNVPNGGDGGSGGGAKSSDGGYNGINGKDYSSVYIGGKGQGTTTRAFGEVDGTLYAGGGGGGGYAGGKPKAGGSGGSGGGGDGGDNADSGSANWWEIINGKNGTPNTGGGGGGASGVPMENSTGGSGGSGIAIIRWKRN